jgi:hypothetical protein
MIKTYGDVFRIIKTGKKVIITNHYGNSRIYFIDENGIPKSKYNDSIPNSIYDFDENNNIEISSTSVVEII